MRKLIIFILLMSVSSFAYADTIHLKSGRKIEGKIIEKPKIPPETIPPIYKVETPYGIVTLKESEIKTIEYKDIEFQPIKKGRVSPREETRDYYNKLVKIAKELDEILNELSSAINEMIDTGSGTYKGTRFRTFDYSRERTNACLHKLRKIHPPPRYRQYHRYLLEYVGAIRDSLHWAQYDSWDKSFLALERAKSKGKMCSEELRKVDTNK